MKLITRTTVALVLLLALVSCGDDDEAAPERADLNDLALALDDLPPGFTQDESNTSNAARQLECIQVLDDPEEFKDKVTGQGISTFASGQGIPLVNHILMRYDTVATATGAMDRIAVEADGCTIYRSADEAGQPIDAGFEPTPLPEVEGADRQETWKMTAEPGADSGAGVTLTAIMVAAQKGEHVSLLIVATMGELDPDMVVDLAGASVGKLPAPAPAEGE